VRLLEMGCTPEGWQVGSLATTRSHAYNPSAELDVLLTGPSSTTVCQLHPPPRSQHDQQHSVSGQSLDHLYVSDQSYLQIEVGLAQARLRDPMTHLPTSNILDFGSGFQ